MENNGKKVCGLRCRVLNAKAAKSLRGEQVFNHVSHHYEMNDQVISNIFTKNAIIEIDFVSCCGLQLKYQQILPENKTIM